MSTPEPPPGDAPNTSEPAASPPPAAPSASPAAQPRDAAWVARARSAFTRYKVMAFVTGAFLILLCVEMLLKYVLQVNGVDASGSPRAVLGDWIAIIHGWIYVIYVATVFDLWSRMRWSFGRIIALIAGGVVPALSFVMERRAHRWFQARVAAVGPAAAADR